MHRRPETPDQQRTLAELQHEKKQQTHTSIFKDLAEKEKNSNDRAEKSCIPPSNLTSDREEETWSTPSNSTSGQEELHFSRLSEAQQKAACFKPGYTCSNLPVLFPPWCCKFCLYEVPQCPPKKKIKTQVVTVYNNAQCSGTPFAKVEIEANNFALDTCYNEYFTNYDNHDRTPRSVYWGCFGGTLKWFFCTRGTKLGGNYLITEGWIQAGKGPETCLSNGSGKWVTWTFAMPSCSR